MCPNHRRVRRRIGLHVAPGARLSSEPDPDAHFCPHTGNQGGAIVPQFPLHEARCLPAEHEGAPQVPALSTPHSQPTFLEPGQSPSRGLRTREAEREQVPPVNFHLSLSSVPVQS